MPADLPTALSASADGAFAATAAGCLFAGSVLLRRGLSGGEDAGRCGFGGAVAEAVVAATAWLVGGAALAGMPLPIAGGPIDAAAAASCVIWATVAGGGLAVAGTSAGGRVLFAAVCGGLAFPVLSRLASVVPALGGGATPAALPFHLTAGAAALVAARLVRPRRDPAAQDSPVARPSKRTEESAVTGAVVFALGLAVTAGGPGVATATVASLAAAAAAVAVSLRVRGRIDAGELATACVGGAVAVLPQRGADAAQLIVTGLIAGVVAVVVRRGLRRGRVKDAGGPAGHLGAALWGLLAANVFGVVLPLFPPVFATSLLTLVTAAAFGPAVWLLRLRWPAERPLGFRPVVATAAVLESAHDHSGEVEALREQLSAAEVDTQSADDRLREATDEIDRLSESLSETEAKLAVAEDALSEERLRNANVSANSSIFEEAAVPVTAADTEADLSRLDVGNNVGNNVGEDAMWSQAPDRSGFLSDVVVRRRPADRRASAEEATFATLDRLNSLLDEALENPPRMAVVEPPAEEAEPVEVVAAVVETAAAEPVAEEPPEPVDRTPPLPEVEVSADLLDTGELHRRCLGDDGFFSAVLQQLSDELPSELDAIEQYLGREDFAAAAGVVGRVSKFAGDAAAGELHAAAADLVGPLQAGDWDNAAARYVVLHDSGLRTLSAVRQVMAERGLELATA